MQSRKNKKKMCQNLQNLLTTYGEPESLVYFNPDILRKCIHEKELKDVSSEYNHAYEVCIVDKSACIVLLEVLPDYYKVIDSGIMWGALRSFAWHFYQGDVCTLTSQKNKNAKNPKFNIERTICNLMNGDAPFRNSKKQIHHKWFRTVALEETITLIPKDTHQTWHQIVGRYARNQVINIRSKADFALFIGELLQVRTILKNKICGLEF